ncbi:hybrid sensor histidine kinase/response regulator [Bradyrhizobium glycinis]|uniref:hybrid sensor histidine kinase/response regulator n=1 Tax=Bradyrhizobium glycinis TaxID=2751812 RepID=UPI0018D7A4E7|nr:PAS domain-containing sensor histidine kinase [Bradyrhizobium glycinis]MBH5370559.1 PAS domain S-box protein [Bradyrhizobium glycinis]
MTSSTPSKISPPVTPNNATDPIYEPAFDTVDIGLIVVDSAGRIVAWNDWMARTSKRSTAEVLGKDFFDVFPKARTTRLPSVIEDAFQVGSSSLLTHTLNSLLPLRLDDGGELLHNIIVRPVPTAESNYCLLQVTDVTAAVTRERVLRERQNARYHAIVDSAPDAIITVDADQNIQWVNGAVDRVLGYDQTELIGQKLSFLLQSEDTLVRLLAEGTIEQQDKRAVSVVGRYKNGTFGHFEISLGRWGADQRNFVTTIWRDVSERVNAESALSDARDALQKSNEELEDRVNERTREREVALRQLHESQKMESIGQLTGGVAHDFNNLLAVILGSLSLLKKALPDDPRISRLLDRAMQGAERGATLTTRLLAFARRQELKIEVVSLQTLIPEMLDFLRHSVGPNIVIHAEVMPDVDPVAVDANQLELALINLAVNARDAMPHGGSLTIACHNEENAGSAGLPPGSLVCITVTDTGEGMSEETLARAQEPFFTTKGVGKGTGLGLSMVHGFTAQSGGAMRLQSQRGEGTTVTMWLPRAKHGEKPASSEIRPAAPELSRRLRVLLVDDDVLVSMGAADMLLDLGHSVTEAQSGGQALKLLDSDPLFDIVVTDYAMPGMNGLELAQRIKELHPKLPIILATGYAELPSDRPIEFEHLSKPYTSAHLASALEKAFIGVGPA